jgi:hypothetical protein
MIRLPTIIQIIVQKSGRIIMNKVIQNTFWKIIYVSIYFLIVIYLYKKGGLKQDYYLNALALLIGFAIITTKSIIYCYKEGKSKRNRDLIPTYFFNYPLVLFVSLNLIFPLLLLITKIFQEPYGVYFSMSIFLCVGYEIDSIYNDGKIYEGIRNYIKKIFKLIPWVKIKD